MKTEKSRKPRRITIKDKDTKIYDAASLALNVILIALTGNINAQEIKSLTSALKDLAAVMGVQTDLDRQEQEARITRLQRQAEREAGEDDREIVLRIMGMSNEEAQEIFEQSSR